MSGIAELATTMTSIARTALTAFTGPQRDAALFPFPDQARTQWSYLPGERPGVGLLGLNERARKAAHRLLATALSRHTFAQAVTIMALEEVLDLDEEQRRGRYSDDYRVAIFGTPGDDAWAWRFEGHHLSATATVIGDQVVVAPLFLGANPARIEHRGRLVLGPLSREEELARAVLADLPPDVRGQALVADTAPRDIRTRISPRVDGLLEPVGIGAAHLPATARDLLGGLVASYLERLTPVLAERELRQLDLDELTFAWEGGGQPGEGHYYRLQSSGLLIEYDNTQRNANHAHTVLRRPGADFGEDLLTAHLATEHG
jgi:uncharacterized protein DUF3500